MVFKRGQSPQSGTAELNPVLQHNTGNGRRTCIISRCFSCMDGGAVCFLPPPPPAVLPGDFFGRPIVPIASCISRCFSSSEGAALVLYADRCFPPWDRAGGGSTFSGSGSGSDWKEMVLYADRCFPPCSTFSDSGSGSDWEVQRNARADHGRAGGRGPARERWCGQYGVDTRIAVLQRRR